MALVAVLEMNSIVLNVIETELLAKLIYQIEKAGFTEIERTVNNGMILLAFGSPDHKILDGSKFSLKARALHSNTLKWLNGPWNNQELRNRLIQGTQIIHP